SNSRPPRQPHGDLPTTARPGVRPEREKRHPPHAAPPSPRDAAARSAAHPTPSVIENQPVEPTAIFEEDRERGFEPSGRGVGPRHSLSTTRLRRYAQAPDRDVAGGPTGSRYAAPGTRPAHDLAFTRHPSSAGRMSATKSWKGIRLHTIGHSTRSLDELAEMLRAFGVSTVVDVRTVPRSRRNPQFGRDVLGPELRAR